MKNTRDVKAFLYEPDKDLRANIRGTMRDAGFADIIDTDRPDLFAETMADGMIDIAVCDVNPATGMACSLLGDLRHKRIGENPFPVMLGVTADHDEKHVARMIDAGFDTLTLKPFNPQSLRRRLEYFLVERKPFVVTAGYVGPDRRNHLREDATSAPQLMVPNPVQLIADGMSREELMTQIKDAAAELDERKLHSNVSGLVWLAQRIAAAIAVGNTAMAHRYIRQLTAIAEDIDIRLERTAYGHVRELCDSLLGVAARLDATTGTPDRKDTDLLHNLATAIKRATAANNKDASYAREVTALMDAHT